MDKEEYKCAYCGEIYAKVNDDNWSDDKAMQECADKFGPAFQQQDCDIVCDDCYKRHHNDR